MKSFIAIVIATVLILQGGFGQVPEKKQYTAIRITTPPVINGILDDAAWQAGTWVDDFIQNEPYNGRQPSQRTAFNILFDDNNLYVAIKAYDTSPDSIVNRLTRRDQEDGELVAIILDTYHDLRTGFIFSVTSSGVKYDGVFTNDGQNTDLTWDPNWWVRTYVNREGWNAEMKIPFSAVRFKKNSGDVWGLEIGRVLYRKNETSLWQHILKDAPGLIHHFGELKGVEQIKPRKIFDITPFGVARAETFKAVPENPFLKKGRLYGLNGGIDAKIGVTNNMTMDLTINPDFGQVEADPSVVNLTAYETFFSEKRPFFIEGNQITNFDLGIDDEAVGNDNLFYSRRIGRKPQAVPDLKDGWYADVPIQTDIIGAAKLTGKTKNGLSVGFLEALTAGTKAEIDTIGGRIFKTVEPPSNYFVGRMQKDIHDGNTIIGGILTGTNRNLDANSVQVLHKAAYSGGADFMQYFKEKSWRLSFKAAFSLVQGSPEALKNTQMSSTHYFQRPDNHYAVYDSNRTSLAGSAGRIQMMKLDGHWRFLGSATWRTPGFEINDIGYIRDADQILSVLWAGYEQWIPKWIYRDYHIGFNGFSVWNFGGNNIGKGVDMTASMNLKNFFSVSAEGTLINNSLDQTILRGGPMMKTPGNFSGRFVFSSDNRKKIVFDLNAFGAKGLEKNSSEFKSGFGISYKPTNYLSFSFKPSFGKSFSELQYLTAQKVGKDDKYIFASIDRKTISASLRVDLNLSPDLTLQYWGQPFVSSGRYYNHKVVVSPVADEFRDRFMTYSQNQIRLLGEQYEVDENMDGITDYSFDNKDFNVQEFLSNLVFRWEYNPGSSVYFVWSQARSNSDNKGYLDLLNNLGDLFDPDDTKPHNVFLIKFSYRFGLR